VKKYYCEKCDCRVDSTVTKKQFDLPVKGESTVFSASIRICDVCGGECYDEDLEQKLFETAYDIYRTKHNIISPVEIFELREKYGLSQRSLAALLGWGEITIHRYEKGSLPDDAHNQTLQFLTDPTNMLKVFKQNIDKLKPRQQKLIEARLNDLIKGGEVRMRQFISPQEQYEPSIYTGYKKFSAETFENMVLYFTRSGVLITKLNKLLWYADFLYFKLHSVSISGTTYVPINQGPVPDDFRFYFNEMEYNGDVLIDEIYYAQGYTGQNVVAQTPFNPESLPSSALEIMKSVEQHFKRQGSKGISEISHLEPGYKKTKKSKPISYEFADKLKEKIPVK